MVWLDNDRSYLHANAAARLYLRLTLHQIQALRADDLVPREHQRALEASGRNCSARDGARTRS
jgi:hypothetical protein